MRAEASLLPSLLHMHKCKCGQFKENQVTQIAIIIITLGSHLNLALLSNKYLSFRARVNECMLESSFFGYPLHTPL